MNVHLFINGMGNISPQPSWNATPPSQFEQPAGNRLACVEPPYEALLDPRASRRMSRILRMGAAAGLLAMREAGITQPGAIVTGTGFGCLEDTGTFLSRMIANHEEALNPTPFIQSTHNTIGSQLALVLGCQAYNQTYAHGGFSFENALLDAAMLLQENPDQQLLVGGVDEITDLSHSLLGRFGIFRSAADEPGMVHGEGATYFVVSGVRTAKSVAEIRAIVTSYKPTPVTLRAQIVQTLEQASLLPGQVDLVLSGICGNPRFDRALSNTVDALFPASAWGRFKHLCGEYPVASAFGVWLAAMLAQSDRVPANVQINQVVRTARYVLVINQYFGTHYSLVLLKTCRGTTSSASSSS